MEDTISVWRSAMTDETHPRYKAAWVLFAPSGSASAAARLLQDQSLDVIPWLYEILDTDALYQPGSPGQGYAPVRAIGLLGAWQVTAAIPRLLTIIEVYTWEDDIFDETIGALEMMGAEVLDPVLALAEQIDQDKRVDLTAVVCRVGAGDDRSFPFIQQVLEAEPDDDMRSFVIGNLRELDYERARVYLADYRRRVKLGPNARRALDNPRVQRP